MISTIVTCVSVCGAAVAGVSDYAPATRGWVNVTVEDKVGSIKRDLANTRLQVNNLRRENLEKEKSDRALQLQSETNSSTRQLLEQRLRQINDDLQDVQSERTMIRATSP